MDVIILACGVVGIGFLIRDLLVLTIDEYPDDIVETFGYFGYEVFVRLQLPSQDVDKQSSQRSLWECIIIYKLNGLARQKYIGACNNCADSIDDQIPELLASQFVSQNV